MAVLQLYWKVKGHDYTDSQLPLYVESFAVLNVLNNTGCFVAVVHTALSFAIFVACVEGHFYFNANNVMSLYW